MPTCPRCHATVDDGLAQCPSCATPLAGAPGDERFVRVFRTGSVVEAETVRAVLEDRGIPCRQKHEAYTIVPDTSPLTLDVPRERQDEAMAILREIAQAPSPEIDEASGEFKEIEADAADVVPRGDASSEAAARATPSTKASFAANVVGLARIAAGLYTLALGIVSLSSGARLAAAAPNLNPWVPLVTGAALVVVGIAVAVGSRWAVLVALAAYLADVALQVTPVDLAGPLDLAGRSRTPLQFALSVAAVAILAVAVAFLPRRR